MKNPKLMIKYTLLFLTLTLFWNSKLNAQQLSSEIIARLNVKKKEIDISQTISYLNNSKDTLKEIYFHNWMNGYKNKNTPLSKRLIEDYDKSLYFAKEKNRGYSKIIDIKNKTNNKTLNFNNLNYDVIKVDLNKPLLPKEKIIFEAKYFVKVPNSKFTEYGVNKKQYNLKYWHLTTAIYNDNWEIMHNYNMDDLYSNPTIYKVQFTLPNGHFLESNLNTTKKITTKTTTYFLEGENQLDTEVSISKNNNFSNFKIDNNTLVTNLKNNKLNNELKNNIANRQVNFIKKLLGEYPHSKIFVNKTVYDKNPVYGLNQLPKILNPFSQLFLYDIQLFKALTNKYINNTLPINKRNNYWLNDGIQTYLLLKYVEKYYPEKKAMGAISNIWGVRTYKLAKLSFNDKYAFVHQFAMRKNLDQSLNTSADSLSTFNRKIVNKYKAGLGIIYLNDYLDNKIINNSIKEYFKKNALATKVNKSFKEIISSKTSKKLDWFFSDYLTSNKKIDYTIKKVKITNDSLLISIKNKSDFTAPISIYGIKDKQIIYKKWFNDITDFSTIKIPKGDFDRISLNYEAKYPEINLNDNWKNLKPSLFNRPLQVRFMKDIDNPYYNQVFYNAEYSYNFYDGIILGLKLTNKTLFKKKWLYYIKPTYGLKNKEINGSLGGIYTIYPKNKIVQKFRSGFSYSSYNYAPELRYQRLSPFVSLDFKRKSLRDVGGKNLSTRFLIINKEVDINNISLESDKYAVFNTRYTYYKPDIIKNTRYNFDFQTSKKFSKINFELQYRKLQKNNTQIDVRFYVGSFIHNKTTSGFFDYSLNRPSDYLFDYNYFGRSENSGFLSQQIIISEGGFKSIFKNNTANQWIATTNASLGIWRWIEVYGDVGIYKNKGYHSQFKYDSGIRLNFVQNFFEVYFPIQSSNGFEAKQHKYPEKIRFVLTLSIGKIYNFIKRGFY